MSPLFASWVTPLLDPSNSAKIEVPKWYSLPWSSSPRQQGNGTRVGSPILSLFLVPISKHHSKHTRLSFLDPSCVEIKCEKMRRYRVVPCEVQGTQWIRARIQWVRYDGGLNGGKHDCFLHREKTETMAAEHVLQNSGGCPFLGRTEEVGGNGVNSCVHSHIFANIDSFHNTTHLEIVV